MSAKRFLAHVQRMPALRGVGLLYAQIEQTAVCNIRHQSNKRLARWLLEAHDRIQKPELSLSHELLALILGTRRPGVTEAIGVLKKSGIIGTGRRRIFLHDRDALERVSCECYRMLKTETARLLGAKK